MSISLTFSERREFSVYTATDRKLTVYCGDVLKFLPSAIIAINVECDFVLATLPHAPSWDPGCIAEIACAIV